MDNHESFLNRLRELRYTMVDKFNIPEANISPMGIITPEIPVDSVGGFSVPPHLVDEIKKMFTEGGCIRGEVQFNMGVKGTWIEEEPMFIEIGGTIVNCDNISVVDYELKPISEELSEGGIFNVKALVRMNNGNDLVFDAEDELRRLCTLVGGQSENSSMVRDRTFGYYVGKMVRYYEGIRVENGEQE